MSTVNHPDHYGMVPNIECIDVIEVGVDQDEAAVCFSDVIGLPGIIGTYFRPQKVAPGIARHMNRHIRRQMRVFSPQFRVVFSPGEQM